MAMTNDRVVTRNPWLVWLVAMVVVLVTARLGFWQLSRAAQKQALQTQMHDRVHLPPLRQAELALPADAPDLVQGQHYRRVSLQGRWLSERTIYLDNRQMNGRQGFYVVTPLLLSAGDAVLVQRGFVLRDFSDRQKLPPLNTPTGLVRVEGQVVPPPSALLALGVATETGVIRQNVGIDAFSKEIGVALRPSSVQQVSVTVMADPDTSGAAGAVMADDHLMRQWPVLALDVSKHHGYAFQWFALCALTLGGVLWFQYFRPRWNARRTTG
jgi:surfeit locus 1 family protein